MRILLFIYTIVMTLVVLAALAKPARAADVRQLIRAEAIRQGVDPDLALAIAVIESNLKQNAKGSQNEVGIFQLHPKFHSRSTLLYTATDNVSAGITYLRRTIALCTPKYGDAAFVCFNAGPYQRLPYKNVRSTNYFKKVTAELRKLRGANAGK